MDNDDHFDQLYALDHDYFQQNYQPILKLGVGKFGKVYLCEQVETKVQYAVKFVSLHGNIERKRREVENMRRLPSHPNIVNFIESFADSYLCAIVLEYCPGQDLFKYLDEVRHWVSFPESEARPIFVQLARAVAFLHEHNEVHRDIKPENIMVINQPQNNGQLVIKLFDFGISKYIGEGGSTGTIAGTAAYMAPEVLKIRQQRSGSYGPSCDCWSVGVVLYVLLFSTLPEYSNNRLYVHLPPTLDVLVGGNIIGAKTRWNCNISPIGRNLLQLLLLSEPVEARLTMKEALGHPWVAGMSV